MCGYVWAFCRAQIPIAIQIAISFYRVCFVLVTFFAALAVLAPLYPRAHSGFWGIKASFLSILLGVSFCVQNSASSTL